MGGTNQKAENINKAHFQNLKKTEYPNVCIVGEVLNTETNDYYFHFQSLYAIDSQENEKAEVLKQSSMTGTNISFVIIFKIFQDY